MDNIFNINNFNVISDDEYYYFFRALEELDMKSIENGSILDENGNIIRLMTDREFYGEKNRFKKDSIMSFDEVFSHIKMHYDRHTNCISFTINANVVLTYGRSDYSDKYVVLKVPKKEFGKDVIFAPEYMLKELEKEINKIINTSNLDKMQIFYLNAVNNSKTEEDLEKIKLTMPKEYIKPNNDIFENGLKFDINITNSLDYQTLNKNQNFIKNKLILKLDIIKENILKHSSNRFLIQTIGNAFSSGEIIHYKDVKGNMLINISKEMMDIISLVQQLPKDNILVKDLMRYLINYINTNNTYNLESFKEENEYLKGDIRIDNMYELTKGNIPYGEASKIYKQSYYIVKSKLRCINTCKLLRKITNNDIKYKELIDYIERNCYGIESNITTRLNKHGLKLSEGVNLNVTNKETELVNKLSTLEEHKLKYILSNPLSIVQEYLKDTSYIKPYSMNKAEYYANSIIDLFDFEKLGIGIDFSYNQRKDIVNRLLQYNIVEIYENLKKQNIKEKDISNMLLTTIIKNKDINNIDKYDTFTITELEDFIGYNKIKGTTLKLRKYQRIASDSISRNFENKKYTTAVLPTGSGKSFVALTQMYINKDNKLNNGILYLAPNVEILNQLKSYIWEFFADKSLTKTEDEIINEVFPGLVLSTYAYLDSENARDLINKKYNLIICDELHRTGATVSNKNIDTLFKNQNNNTKILGITATPLRDADSKNMAKYWAKYFNYTDEEIEKNKHLSIDIDLFEAIEKGYIVNPKVVSCEYNLLKDGHIVSLLKKIENIKNEDLRKEKKKKYEELRRSLEKAKGIKEIINDNIKPGGKYIVFCPVRTKKGNLIEDEYGNQLMDTISSNSIMETYVEDFKKDIELFMKENNLSYDDIEITSMLGSYSYKENEMNLNSFNRIDDNKTKFMLVMNKLNEGVHVDSIDGIIWKRPINQKSRILYLQQLGRCIYAVDPNKEYLDEERPVVIDLVNNTMNVILEKEESNYYKYLNKIKYIYDWYMTYNKYPNLNSYDVEESKLGVSLKDIQTRFIMYLNNEELYKPLSNKDIFIIKEIISTGEKMDLWEYDFDIREKLTLDEKLNIYINMLNNNYEPHYFDGNTNFEGTSIQINNFLKTNINTLIIPKLFFELNEDTLYNNARNKILKFLNVSSIDEYIKKNNQGDLFKLVGSIRDFYEFEKEINNLFDTNFEERLNEIKELGYVPKVKDRIRFKDNSAIISDWIHTLANKEKIIELSKTNEIAKWIVKEKGWLVTIEDRLKEIRELGYVPIASSKIKFKDNSANIGVWIHNSPNRQKIIALSSVNENAKWIAEKLGWINKVTIEDRLKEIRELGYVPKTRDKVRFKNNSTYIGPWLNKKENRNKIMELSSINEDAKWIVEELGWMNKATFEDRLKEIRELGYVPKTRDKVRFKNNSTCISSWLHLPINKEKIIELSETNEIAKWIAEEKNWINKVTIEDRLKEIRELGYVPNSTSIIRFKNNSTKIYTWLCTNKEKIIELSISNEIAKWIAEELGWINKATIEDRLNEIKELGYVPRNKDILRFKDNTITIYNWMIINKEKIIELSRINEIAKWIAEEKKWINKVPFEDRLKEIKELGYVPKVDDKIRFKDNTTCIGNFIHRYKEKIIELSKINEIAKWIAEEIGWINKATFEDRLKEIKELGYVPKVDDKIRFKDNSAYIISWLHSPINKEKIIELSETNEIAKWIAVAKKWINKATFEDRLKEIRNLGYIPKYESKEKFKDNSKYIGLWLSLRENRNKIILLSSSNEDAKWIAEERGWINRISFEDRLKEIKELGYIPKEKDKIRFKDNSMYIDNWINKYKIKLIELSETNEIARWICYIKKWLVTNDTIINNKFKNDYLKIKLLYKLKNTLETINSKEQINKKLIYEIEKGFKESL